MLFVIPEMYLADVEDMSRREVSHDNLLHEPEAERWVFRARFQHYCGIALILAGAHFAPLPSLWGLVGHPTLAALSLSLLSWIALTHSQGRMAVRLRHSITDLRIRWLYLALFLAAIGCIGVAAATRNEALSKMGLLLLLLIFELHLLHKEWREKA
jgi:hypothetical protein